MSKPLFVLFVNSSLSTKLVQLIEQGIIHARIYSPNILSIQIKKIFTKHTKGNFQIFDCNLPYNFDTFNFILTSNTFWDTLPTDYSHIYILYNPKAFSLQINFKELQQLPFNIIPCQQKLPNVHNLLKTNPTIFDEIIKQSGFLLYINYNFAKRTLKYYTKTKILQIREKFEMSNNEAIKRQTFLPFYMYFYHHMIDSGYNL